MKLRLGSISFINSLPVDWGLLSGKVPTNAQLVTGAPAELNLRMLEGNVDLGPASAYWVAKHRDAFRVLPDLSIGSESGVESVLLFSRVAPEKLAGKKISVSSKGRTTPVLLEILCRQRWGFTPELEAAADSFEMFERGKADAALVIGDEALEARLEAGIMEGVRATDLAEEWRAWTGLPFVFALWAVRRDTFEARPEEVIEAWRSVKASREWGLAHRDEVTAEAARRLKLPAAVVTRYFSRLRYDFDASLKKGLELYLRKAAECGFLPENAELDFAGTEAVAS